MATIPPTTASAKAPGPGSLGAVAEDANALERTRRALTGVQQALGRLRGIETVSGMLDKAPLELCRCCGFDRAILSRVEGSHLVAETAWFEGEPEFAAQVVALWRSDPPELNHLLLETEILRRRAPALVTDPAHDPRAHAGLVAASQTVAYVAAPVMPEGRVIGFLHADRRPPSPPVDELDRDALFTFSEGFGYAMERTILLERLRSQSRHVRQQVMSLEAILNEYGRAPLELAPISEDIGEVFRTAASMFVAPESRVDALLTRRELEVLGLMAGGATNAEIADRLVIAEGTVKSHVKHILRKLRAANRAEAVSRYVQLTVPPKPPGMG